jgi:hypothetical protein
MAVETIFVNNRTPLFKHCKAIIAEINNTEGPNTIRYEEGSKTVNTILSETFTSVTDVEVAHEK